MTSFLGFKLKGSSFLELKTDLCILWNEHCSLTKCIVHSALTLTIKHKLVQGPCLCHVQEAVYNYSVSLFWIKLLFKIILFKIKNFDVTWHSVSYFNSYWAMPYLREIATLRSLKKKKTLGFWMGPFKREAVFHLVLVVILAMWFHHQGALEAHTWLQGVLWRWSCPLEMPGQHKLEPISPFLPPTLKCSAHWSTLSHSFHEMCSKEELIKGPLKWLPFQSYYFTITKGE